MFFSVHCIYYQDNTGAVIALYFLACSFSHRHSQEFDLEGALLSPEGLKFEAESGRGVLGPDRKCILDALRAQKTCSGHRYHLVIVSRFNSFLMLCQFWIP